MAEILAGSTAGLGRKLHCDPGRLELDAGHVAGHAEQAIHIDLEIVSGGAEAGRVLQLDGVGQVFAEQIHRALHGFSIAGDLIRVQLESATAGGRQRADNGERLAIFLARHFHAICALWSEPQILEIGMGVAQKAIKVLGQFGKTHLDLIALMGKQAPITCRSAFSGTGGRCCKQKQRSRQEKV